ncbi:MAG: ATP-binding protein [Gemmatimonadetes bacterium]|nr:ATP-binding protein [Gemmatimonadota bacterium]MYD13500.1 ATP-binding protein [Gemmatimonadota bacterium]
MIPREASARVAHLLGRAPAVVLTGPRQVGKTTVALEFVREHGGAYLDLEDPRDRAKLADVHKYCERNAGRLVVLDEIHRTPGLFEPLRGIVDQRRREGRRAGHFLLLGSASIDLLRQTGETLAGRVAYCEMQPLNVREAVDADVDDLWQRGGMPDSLLAGDEADSFEWRFDFIRTYLDRDIPALGPRIPRETLRRFWTMLAHDQGRPFNASVLARSLGLSGRTVGRYLDLMVDLLLVRRLPSWRRSARKRLVKAPRAYLRDSGVCHALLGIDSYDALLGHPVAGGSWEGFVIENILSGLPAHVASSYYRSTGGAEIDLVLELGGGRIWAIEIMRSSAPKVSRGFHIACDDVGPDRRLVVHGGDESFPMREGIEAVSLRDLCAHRAPLAPFSA